MEERVAVTRGGEEVTVGKAIRKEGGQGREAVMGESRERKEKILPSSVL